jgi:RNA polymerase sigma factor (sigma-70 family)
MTNNDSLIISHIHIVDEVCRNYRSRWIKILPGCLDFEDVKSQGRLILCEYLMKNAIINSDDKEKLFKYIAKELIKYIRCHQTPYAEQVKEYINYDPCSDQDIKIDMQIVHSMKDVLSGRELKAIKMRYEGYTTIEIGKEIGLSRNRASEIIIEAVKKIRKEM